MSIETIISLPLLATTFTTLFVIMDPPGSIPVFLALTGRLSRPAQNKAAIQATITSFFVIIGFAVLGNSILRALQISIEALQLSGGVLLFLVAMELLMGSGDLGAGGSGSEDANVAMVPLGTPLLAGPGAIVAVMVAVNQGKNTLPGWVAVMLAVVLMHVVIYLTLRFSIVLARVLGKNGVVVLTKIAGVLLGAIATQLAVNAIFQMITDYRIG